MRSAARAAMRSARRKTGDKPRSALLFGCNVPQSSIYLVCPDVNGSWATLVSVFLAVLRREKERERESEACLDWS